MGELDGKVALVTGSGRNLGRAISLALAGQGCSVVVHARSNRDEAAAVAEEIRSLGVRSWVATGDVGDHDEATGIAMDALALCDRIDVLVNNVGIRPHTPFLQISAAEWQRTLDVNLRAAFSLCQAVLPGMVDRASGSIINISGVIADTGGFDESRPNAHVTVSKAGLDGLTRAVAWEFGRHGIRANSVVPAMTASGVAREGAAADLLRSKLAAVPLGRLAERTEIAEVCAFLASDRSSYVTGQSIQVNGGFYMT